MRVVPRGIRERSEESRKIIMVDRGEGERGAYDPGLSRGMARGGNKKGNKPVSDGGSTRIRSSSNDICAPFPRHGRGYAKSDLK